MVQIRTSTEVSELQEKLRKLEEHEEQLRQSEALLLETQRVAGLGTYVLDFKAMKWNSSPVLDVIFGLESEPERDVPVWFTLIHRPWQVTMQDYLANHILRDKMPFDKVYQIVRKSDNEVRWVHGLGQLIKDGEGNLIRMVGTIQDITKQKEIELALRESEQKYRTLTEQLIDVMYTTDLHANITFMSPASSEIFGYTPEEMIGRSFVDFLDKADIERAFGLYSKSLDEKISIQGLRFRMLKKSGESFIGELSGSALIQDGVVTGVLGLIRDVTEQETASEVARKNDSRMRNLIELSQSSVEDENIILHRGLIRALHQTESHCGFVIQLDAAMKPINTHTLCSLQTGVEPDIEEVKDFPNVMEWVQNEFEKSNDVIYNSIPEDSPFSQEMRPGSPKMTRLMLAQIRANGQLVGLIGVANKTADYDEQDAIQLTLLMDSVWKIRERLIAERELREKKEELDRYFANTLDMLCIADTDGRFIRLNREWSNALGYSLDELIGKKYIEYVHPADVDSTLDANTSLKDGKEVRSFVNRYRAKDGTYKWLEWRSVAVEDLVYAVARDMTVHYKLEAELRQSQKLDAVGRLAGGIAHDFNNMLAVILGLVELAMLKVDKENSLYQDLRQIEHAAERSADLTRQLLAFSRKQIIEPQVIDLNESLKDQIKMINRLIGEDIAIELELSESSCPVRIDPSQFDQLLVNLAANARDAIQGNGRITIKTGIIPAEEIELHPENETLRFESYVEVCFTDTGAGIAKADLEKIFDPFFTTKPNGKGTGLGLATVYGIVSQNDGFLNVESELGKGTTFRLLLPLSKESIQVEGIEGNESNFGDGETILVVEDELLILTIAERILTEKGYKVLTAQTPSEAIELVSKAGFHLDLILSDMILPEMNGRDMCDKIREVLPEVVIVFMSGYTADVIATRGIVESGLHFIQKPFTSTSLLRKVRDALDLNTHTARKVRS